MYMSMYFIKLIKKFFYFFCNNFSMVLIILVLIMFSFCKNFRIIDYGILLISAKKFNKFCGVFCYIFIELLNF